MSKGAPGFVVPTPTRPVNVVLYPDVTDTQAPAGIIPDNHVIPSLEYTTSDPAVNETATNRPVRLHVTEDQSELTGKGFDAVHVIPSSEYAASVPFATITKRPVMGLHVTDDQFVLTGKAPEAFHVIPLSEYAADVPFATTTKRPVMGLHVTDDQFVLDGKLVDVHVIPSLEYAASVPVETETNRPVQGLHVAEIYVPEVVKVVPDDHVEPSDEYAVSPV